MEDKVIDITGIELTSKPRRGRGGVRFRRRATERAFPRPRRGRRSSRPSGTVRAS